MKRHLLWLIVIAAALLGLGAGMAVRYLVVSDETTRSTTADASRADDTSGTPAPAIVGRRRPSFQLPDRDGDEFAIADLAGQVVLLNFWASWCPPCVREMPALDGLQDELGQRGLRVVGVALEDRTAMTEFARENDIDYRLLVGGRAGFDIASDYGNARGVLPYTVVIDRDGTVRARHQGALTRAQAHKLVAPYL